MRILFLSRWFPYPPNNGSKLRIYNLLRGLSQQHQVTLLSVLDQPHTAPDVSVLEIYCVFQVFQGLQKPDLFEAVLQMPS